MSRPPPAAGRAEVAGLRAGLEVLAHPLPAGMRDLLPAEAELQADLAGKALGCFELFGYQPVSVPAFEYAAVLERGLGALEPQSVLRFVEPDTGEVVALRPDVTPQVARLVATRLSDMPMPARLCYRGSVLRRRHERARHNGQILQAGIELVGVDGPAGDLEVLEVGVAAVRAAGLADFVLDLGHVRIASALLAEVGETERSELVDALTLKDASVLSRRAEQYGLRGRTLEALAALPELSGGEEVWVRAEKVLAGTAALEPARELRELWRRVSEAGIATEVVVDLGETWNFRYYTGPMFHVFAAGPGQAVVSGGRYDQLFERFGISLPAAGCAIDLDNLAWAVGPRAYTPRFRVAVFGPAAAEVARALRGAGVAAAVAGPGGEQFAKSWRFSHLLELGAGASTLRRLTEERVAESALLAPAELSAWVVEQL